MPHPISIILVDDHELFRNSLNMLLNNDTRFTVIAQCGNGTEAIALAEKLLPDILLMDLNMTPVDGFEATQKITEGSPSVKIIGVSINNNPQYAVNIIALGAKGFVTKTSAFKELKTAIQKVYEGEIYICDEIKKKLPSKE